MRVYKFSIEEHPECAGLGLKPVWYPEADPFGGMAAAHDILEHFPAIAAELTAS